MLKHLRFRQANRFRQILNAFIRNGFGFFVQKIGLIDEVPRPQKWRKKEAERIHSTEERIRNLLEELGPTFVKLGQIASTRKDIFPQSLIDELEKLQDHVTSFSYEEVKTVFETEVGESLSDYFDTFEEIPLASASIGQVHKAVTKDGRSVAVKVQRPGIERKISTDLDILYELALLADKHIEGVGNYHLPKLVKEFSKLIMRELDYKIEGRNADRIRTQTDNDPLIYIPEVDWTCTTTRVMTMELIEGQNINQLDIEAMSRERRKLIAETITQSICRQIFIDGFYHADPHPGNVYLMKDDKIALLDFGMVGRLTPELRASLASLVIGILKKDTDSIIKSISRMGSAPFELDRQSLKKDLDEFQDLYFSVPLHEIKFGEVVNDLLALVGGHNIEIPHDVTLVAKALVTVESLISEVDHDLSIIKVVEPLGEELVKEYVSFDHLKKKARTHVLDYMDAFSGLPEAVKKSMTLVERGRLRHEHRLPEVERLGARYARIGNQLTLSVLLLAVSLVLGSLILGITIGDPDQSFWLRLPVLELGFIVFFFLFSWLTISILRNRKK